MKLNPTQFLGNEENIYANLQTARYAILPVPYEGAVSYGRGTAEAPQAVLDVSLYLEFYDEVLGFEPFTHGIVTLAPTPVVKDHAKMHEIIYRHTKEIVESGKFPIILGGDHSISSGVFRALQEKYDTLSCIQLDAHADLRQSYEGSEFSHASVMARIREQTRHALQIGLRSLSKEEAEWIERDNLAVCFMHQFRNGSFNVDAALAALPDPVFLTLDVDVFDWSVISSTGTPEPGGFTWDDMTSLLQKIFARKRVIGFDVVELSASPTDRNSPFAIAKLIYKMIGWHGLAER